MACCIRGAPIETRSGYDGRAGRVAAGRPPGRLEESPDTAGQDAGASQGPKGDGKWHRKQTAVAGSPEHATVRVKRWGKSPPATAATRRLSKPRPVQGEQAPLRRPAEESGSCTDGWSPSTESGLQACYGKSPGNGAFSIQSFRRVLVLLAATAC